MSPAKGRITLSLLSGIGLTIFTLLFSAHGFFVARANSTACVSGPHAGDITSDEQWCLADSPHILAGPVNVLDGVSLTIEPGVVVQAAATARLFIQGNLIAVGNAAIPLCSRLKQIQGLPNGTEFISIRPVEIYAM